MTTPVPTTAAAHLAMVEALRDIVGRDLGHRKYGCVPPVLCSESCPVATARAALEGWEKRPRMRDQLGMHKALATLLDCHRGPWTEDDRGVVLDVFDGLLFGAGPRTGGEQGEGGDRG